jgi:glycine/D-amino acid oxidase-like deaminating enzyme
MGQKDLKAIVIGGGIHGITTAVALAKNEIDVTIIEKNAGLLRGTSAATQNRAHLGYHYPRSIATASECLEGSRVFQERYPGALVYPKEAYYMIERESSRVSAEEFRRFCDQMHIPYEMGLPSNGFINREAVVAGFKVPEPVFDLEILLNLLESEIADLGIAVRTGSEAIAACTLGNRFRITVRQGREQAHYEADIVVNATYAYVNNVLKMLGLEDEMTEYTLQYTEVPIAKSDKEIPALTVMDGEFVSVMPYGRNPNYVLVYDVVHSVVHRENGYLFDDGREYPTNWAKMIDHGEKYYPFIRNLVYVGSLWGARPIPHNVTRDSRKTRVVAHAKCPGVYSIFEGKLISAPLIADRLVGQMKADGIVRSRGSLEFNRSRMADSRKGRSPAL